MGWIWQRPARIWAVREAGRPNMARRARPREKTPRAGLDSNRAVDLKIYGFPASPPARRAHGELEAGKRNGGGGALT